VPGAALVAQQSNNRNDADDAFQATYLVLARKAASRCPAGRICPFRKKHADDARRYCAAPSLRRRQPTSDAKPAPRIAETMVAGSGAVDGPPMPLPLLPDEPAALGDAGTTVGEPVGGLESGGGGGVGITVGVGLESVRVGDGGGGAGWGGRSIGTGGSTGVDGGVCAGAMPASATASNSESARGADDFMFSPFGRVGGGMVRRG
jgi:hypothetical protein